MGSRAREIRGPPHSVESGGRVAGREEDRHHVVSDVGWGNNSFVDRSQLLVRTLDEIDTCVWRSCLLAECRAELPPRQASQRCSAVPLLYWESCFSDAGSCVFSVVGAMKRAGLEGSCELLEESIGTGYVRVAFSARHVGAVLGS